MYAQGKQRHFQLNLPAESDVFFFSPAGISWTETPSPNLTHVSCLPNHAHGMLNDSLRSAILNSLSVAYILSFFVFFAEPEII